MGTHISNYLALNTATFSLGGGPGSNLNTHPEGLRDIISHIRSGNWSSSTAFPSGFGQLRTSGTNELSFSSARFPGVSNHFFRNVGGTIYYRRMGSNQSSWISTTGSGNEYFTYSSGRMTANAPAAGGGPANNSTDSPPIPTLATDTSTLPLVTGERRNQHGVVITAHVGGGWRFPLRHLQQTLRFDSTAGGTIRHPSLIGTSVPGTGGSSDNPTITPFVFRIVPTTVGRGLNQQNVVPTIQILTCPGAGLTAAEQRPISFQTNHALGFAGSAYSNPDNVLDLNNATNFLSNSAISSSALQNAGISFTAQFFTGENPGSGRGRLRDISFQFRRPVAFTSGSQTFIVNNGTARTFTLPGGRRVDVAAEHNGIYILGGTNDAPTLTPYAPPD